MTHAALRPDFRRTDRPLCAGAAGRAPASSSPKGRSGIRRSIIFCSPTCRATCAAAGTRRGRREVMRPSNKCNGMTYDAELNLIVCEHATSIAGARTARRAARGAGLAFRRAGAQQPERRLRPVRRRDLFLRPLVRPHAGLRRRAAAPARLPGRLSRSAGRRRRRNCWSTAICSISRTACASRPDEQLLYVNDTVQATDPRLRRRCRRRARRTARVFASGIRSRLEPGVPDGMKCDAARQCLGTAPGGVWVYAPDGELLGKVRVPELVGQPAWGGPDWRTLYHDRDAFGLCGRRPRSDRATSPIMQRPSGRRSAGAAAAPSARSAPQLPAGDMRSIRRAAR